LLAVFSGGARKKGEDVQESVSLEGGGGREGGRGRSDGQESNVEQKRLLKGFVRLVRKIRKSGRRRRRPAAEVGYLGISGVLPERGFEIIRGEGCGLDLLERGGEQDRLQP